MAHIAKRPNGQWRARDRDVHGTEHARHFAGKIDAQAWLDSTTTAVQSGLYVDPDKGKVTVADWAPRWLAGRAHPMPSTHEVCGDPSRAHPPAVGGRPPRRHHPQRRPSLGDHSRRRAAAATVRKTHRVSSLMLKTAIKDGRVARNPTADVNLPRIVNGEHRYLSHEQVDALATACATPPPGRSIRRPKDEA